MLLEVWSGGWGLPTIDSKCLSVLTYCKFASVPVDINKSNKPWQSPSGSLPVLRDDDATNSGVPNIMDYLRQKNWSLDHNLTSKQSADILAFTALMELNLAPALLHLWWVDSQTYTEITNPWYSKVTPLLLNLVMRPYRHKSNTTLAYNTLPGNGETSTAEQDQQIMKNAKMCLNQLSSKLGNKEYFLGQNAPSSLDAIVFGYLAPLYKVSFPNKALQSHLKACPNLADFVQRIILKHFPPTKQDLDEQRQDEEERRQKQSESTEFPHRTRNLIVAGLIATVTMIGYAFMSGLIQIEISDVDEEKEVAEGESGDEEGDSKSPEPPNFQQFDELFEEEEDEQDNSGGQQR